MQEKSYRLISCLVALILLTSTPAFAGFGEAPTAPRSLEADHLQDPWILSWFQSLFASLSQAWDATDGDSIGAAWEPAEDGETEEDPDASEPDFEVTPMAGPVGDPSG